MCYITSILMEKKKIGNMLCPSRDTCTIILLIQQQKNHGLNLQKQTTTNQKTNQKILLS